MFAGLKELLVLSLHLGLHLLDLLLCVELLRFYLLGDQLRLALLLFALALHFCFGLASVFLRNALLLGELALQLLLGLALLLGQ